MSSQESESSSLPMGMSWSTAFFSSAMGIAVPDDLVRPCCQCPNHDIDVSEGGTWRVGVAPGSEHVEVWSAAGVDAPTRVIDVVTHMEEPFLGEEELQTLFEDAFALLGLTLGRLERRHTLERDHIDISEADESALGSSHSCMR